MALNKSSQLSQKMALSPCRRKEEMKKQRAQSAALYTHVGMLGPAWVTVTGAG